MAPVVITGAALPEKQVGVDPPSRLEINDFVKREEHFSLYIQALQAIQSDPQDVLLSFYQISGIHGLPHIMWNGSPGGENGYCSHGTPIFPTWHRPYVALIEQVIQAHAVQIAATYQHNTERWGAAASTLRQPYWDWAVNAVPPPEIISDQKVTITTPDGKRTLVANPFLRYAFQDLQAIPPKAPDSQPVSDFLKYKTTLRHPKYQGTVIVEDIEELKSTLSSTQSEISEDTFDLFLLPSWDQFSNNAPTDGFSSSLETIHGSIHAKVGGQGHMSSVPYAGFDPIFYLHHCQVDRILAMWSIIHPGEWVPDADLQTALTPFWDQPTSFWVSANVRTGDVLNYCYPEVTSNIAASRQAILAWLNRISKNINRRQPLQSLSGLPGGLASASQAALSGDRIEPPLRIPAGQSLLNWSVRVRCNQYEFGNSFSVYLFLIRVPDANEDWLKSPYFVGSFDTFVNWNAKECANCSKNADRDIEGFVHINAGILQHSGKESLEPDHVGPFLRDNLIWRVRKLDGTISELSTLQVTVVVTPLSLPTGATLPLAGIPSHHHEITVGRPGGLLA